VRGLRPVIGNPLLVETEIESFDVRWEWFLSPLELMSFSVFSKNLSQPIERVVIAQSSNVADSFTNAESADEFGFEFELRKNFGIFSPRLTNLNLLTNVAVVNSNVTVPRGLTQVQTSTSRALQGQAPYVVNAALEYADDDWGTSRLLYNISGNQIDAAGAFGLPDIKLQHRNQLDLVWLRRIAPFDTPLNAKVSIENILDDPYVYTQGDSIQRQYRAGLKITAGLSYSY